MVRWACCVWLLGPVASGHHSFAAEYDVSARVTISGIVRKLEWTNPHAYLYLDNGWGFELGSPNALLREGWTRELLKPGDTVTVTAFRAKDGASRAKADTVTLSGGRKLYGSPGTAPALRLSTKPAHTYNEGQRSS